MNFLGVGPGELLFILIIALVVVGPERLPGMARQAGRMLVRVRNWMQTSPDAAMVLRARQEIEQELAQIRSSLLEVQNVRDEVLGVAKQLDDAVTPITQARIPTLTDLIREPEGRPVPAGAAGQQEQADELVPAAEPALDAALPASAPLPQDPGSGLVLVPESMPVDHALSAAPPPAAADIEVLGLRLQALMADLQALQEQLRLRGLLDADWQLPSTSMPMSGSSPDALSQEAEG